MYLSAYASLLVDCRRFDRDSIGFGVVFIQLPVCMNKTWEAFVGFAVG